MKILRRLSVIAALAACVLTGCKEPVLEEPVKIRLNKEMISSLHVGQTQKLEVSVTPFDAQVSLVWASDNESVAVVDDEGAVTGVAPGTAEVSVTAGQEVARCKVVVLALKPESLGLDVEELDLSVGQTRQLKVVLEPDGASAEDLEWTSGKKSVATVQDGLVTAVAEGQTVVTVSCNGGELVAECLVTVSGKASDKVLVSSINMVSSLELKVGATSVLNVVVLPENADDRSVTFSMEGDCISLDAQTGEVTALKVGTAKVTATANDGSAVKAECSVSVVSQSQVTNVSITADGDASDVQVGKGLQLYAHCLPAGVVPNSVSWTVDDQSKAIVDQSGVVTGSSASKGSDGSWTKVVVTVNADGVTSSMSFPVIPRQPDAIEVDLPEGNMMRVGQQWSFNPRIIPEGLPYTVSCYGAMTDAHGIFTASTPGLKNIDFYISDHEDLVYSSMRTYVHIDVIPYWVETISIPETYTMDNGTSAMLVPEFTSDVQGIRPSYTDIRWVSSDPSVASVDEITGEIIALSQGVTVITVTTAHEWSVPEGTSHKSASCTLTVNESDNSLNVGDYYYSDGTWSSDLNPGKTVIGVVFAKVNATTSDPKLAKDYPGCVNGLVVSTVEYADRNFGAVSAYNGHAYYDGIGYDANLIVDPEKTNGYGNTLAHRDLNASKPDYCVLFNAAEGVVAQHAAAVSAPACASAWYVPSYKEMDMLNQNRDVVNAALSVARGTPLAEPYEREESWDENHSSDWYWTSTIKGVWYDRGKTYDHYKYPYDLSKGGWTTSQQSSGNFKVRLILAF